MKLLKIVIGLLCSLYLSLQPTYSRQEEIDIDHVEKSVKQWLNIPLVSVEKLNGGLTNKSFLATTKTDKHDKLVVRFGKDNSEIFGINRFCEDACIESASTINIAPQKFYSNPDDGTLITSFIYGKNLTEKNICENARLKEVINIIKKCHSIPFKKEFVSPSIYDKIRAMISSLLADENPFMSNNEAERINKIINRIEFYFHKKEKFYEGLCHGDLVAGNFMDDGEKLWLIDWEYACWGNILIDLASFCIELNLTEEKIKEVLNLYFGQNWEENYFDFMLMCIIYNLRDAFWYALRNREIKTLDGICMLEYAKKHLMLFKKTINHLLESNQI